jgi:hypothetical protein
VNAKKYRLVQSCSNRYFRENDDWATILLNPDWRVKPSVLLENGCLQVLTCKWHDGGNDKLTLYPPQSPHGHVLNAEQSDQLAPVVRKHRVTRPMKASKYCTVFQMVQQRCEYSGVSTTDLTNHSDFSRVTELRSQHEEASIIGRTDINMLLQRTVENGVLSQEHANNMVRKARIRFGDEEELRHNTEGATYIGFSDMVRIQLFESSDKKTITLIDDRECRGNRQPQLLKVRRSWSITINILHTEDSTMAMGPSFVSFQNFHKSRVVYQLQ